jgi:hypothetical protein
MLVIFDINRIFHKEFVLAGQTLNSEYCCDILREIVVQKQRDCRPHPPYFSLLPRLKIRIIGRHFDTVEVIEAESQAVLNPFTKHSFHD